MTRTPFTGAARVPDACRATDPYPAPCIIPRRILGTVNGRYLLATFLGDTIAAPVNALRRGQRQFLEGLGELVVRRRRLEE